MAVQLLKRISRELTHTKVRSGKFAGRCIIASLCPGDIMEFHIKGTRQRCEVSLQACYNLAQIDTASRDYKEACNDYTEKKQAGHKRLRKPKRAMFPVRRAYYQAL